MSHFRMSRFYILEFYYLPISGVTRFRCQLLENNIIFRTAHLLIGQASAARSQLIKSWNIPLKLAALAKQWKSTNPNSERVCYCFNLFYILLLIHILLGKYHKRKRVEGQWVFGGVERDSAKCFLIPVADRTANTLIALLLEWVLPETTIISDCWASYRSIR